MHPAQPVVEGVTHRAGGAAAPAGKGGLKQTSAGRPRHRRVPPAEGGSRRRGSRGGSAAYGLVLPGRSKKKSHVSSTRPLSSPSTSGSGAAFFRRLRNHRLEELSLEPDSSGHCNGSTMVLERAELLARDHVGHDAQRQVALDGHRHGAAAGRSVNAVHWMLVEKVTPRWSGLHVEEGGAAAAARCPRPSGRACCRSVVLTSSRSLCSRSERVGEPVEVEAAVLLPVRRAWSRASSSRRTGAGRWRGASASCLDGVLERRERRRGKAGDDARHLAAARRARQRPRRGRAPRPVAHARLPRRRLPRSAISPHIDRGQRRAEHSPAMSSRPLPSILRVRSDGPRDGGAARRGAVHPARRSRSSTASLEHERLRDALERLAAAPDPHLDRRSLGG